MTKLQLIRELQETKTALRAIGTAYERKVIECNTLSASLDIVTEERDKLRKQIQEAKNGD